MEMYTPKGWDSRLNWYYEEGGGVFALPVLYPKCSVLLQILIVMQCNSHGATNGALQMAVSC